jgi:hypothetical protein
MRMDHDTRRVSGTRALIALVGALLLVVGVSGVSPNVARGDTNENCPAQQQALDAVSAEIDRHNTEPHLFNLPQQQAEYDAYNAEAAQLNARAATARSNLNSCAAAMSKLAAGETLPKPDQSTLDKINAAKKGLAPNYTPPSPAPSNSSGGVKITSELRPLFDALKTPAKWSDAALFQGKPRPNVGDADPARGSQTIPAVKGSSRPDVVVDPIVAVAQLLYLPDFLKLPADSMYMVVNAPLNLQWMSAAGNMARGSDSVAAIINADPQWQSEQQQLEKDTKGKLEELVKQLGASLPPS